MKIYLADTIQRERIKLNDKLIIKNHLESFFAIDKNKTDIANWSIFKKEKK